MDVDSRYALPSKKTDWISRFEVAVGKNAACCLLALFIQIFSFVLYPFPPSKELHKYVRYQTMVALCENPFTREPLAEPTIRHRVFVPIVAWGLGLHGEAYIALIFAGTYFFLLNTLLLLRRSLPLMMATLTTLLLSTTLAVITSQSGLLVQDSIANAIIVLCMMLGRFPWSVGPLLFIAMLADERSITMMPLVLLWLYWHDLPDQRRSRLGRRILGIVAAGIAYAVVYVSLHQLDTPVGDHNFYGHADQRHFIDALLSGRYFMRQAAHAPAALWFGLRAAWLLPILLISYHRRRDQWLTDWLMVGIFAATMHGLLVQDMSRLASLAFPAVLLSVVILYQTRPARTSFVVSICLLLNILSPQFQVGRKCTLLIPLPLQSGLSDFRSKP